MYTKRQKNSTWALEHLLSSNVYVPDRERSQRKAWVLTERKYSVYHAKSDAVFHYPRRCDAKPVEMIGFLYLSLSFSSRRACTFSRATFPTQTGHLFFATRMDRLGLSIDECVDVISASRVYNNNDFVFLRHFFNLILDLYSVGGIINCFFSHCSFAFGYLRLFRKQKGLFQ